MLVPSEGVVRFSQDIGCSFRAFVTRKKEHERTQNPINSPNDLPLFVEPCTGGRGQPFTKSTKTRLGSPLATNSVRQLEFASSLQLRSFFESLEVASLPRAERKLRTTRFMTSVPETYLKIPNSGANKQFLPYVELLQS